MHCRKIVFRLLIEHFHFAYHSSSTLRDHHEMHLKIKLSNSLMSSWSKDFFKKLFFSVQFVPVIKLYIHTLEISINVFLFVKVTFWHRPMLVSQSFKERQYICTMETILSCSKHLQQVEHNIFAQITKEIF